jgi:thiol:disulfide interchange protein/DsbC/DsbD-like thiol-disulfide interchange protein
MRLLQLLKFALFAALFLGEFPFSSDPWGLTFAQNRPIAVTQPALGPLRAGAVEAELIADQAAVVPGRVFRLGLRLKHDPHWHTYWRNPGDSGLPTRLSLTLPPGWTAGEVQWPAPQRIRVGPLANFGYDGELVLPIAIQPPARIAGTEVHLEAGASWLVCRDICVPGEAALAVRLPVAATPQASRWQTQFAAADQGIPDPAAAIKADWSLVGRRLAVVFPAPTLAVTPSMEFTFFPEQERVVAPAADQLLERLPDGRWRISLELAAEADAESLLARPAKPARQESAAPIDPLDPLRGVLLLNGRAWPVQAARRAQPESTAGQQIALSVLAAAGSGGVGAEVAGGSGLGASVRDNFSSASPSAASTPAASTPVDRGAALADPVRGAAQGGPGLDSLALGLVLAGSLLGGLLLNLMPCVFPVVGLKVLGFMQDAGGEPRRARHNALAFAGGVVVMFVGLAALMLILRSAGQVVGWGFQLQSPAVVSVLSLLFLALGLNFSGVFEIGLGLTTLGGTQNDAPVNADRPSNSVVQSFASGLLAAIVATPCTAPFMGAAVGFTLTAAPAVALLVFAAIGLGMAVPYLLLGLYPALLARLPRPGRWMQTLRQGLAFPMYATAVWLAWVLGAQLGVDAMLRVGLAGVLVAAGAWWWGRTPTPKPSAWASQLPVAILLAGAIALVWPVGDDRGTTGLGARDSATSGGGQSPVWQAWSPDAVAAARRAGRSVFVDFTAAWCISCQANKKLVLESESIRRAFVAQDVLLLRADWTRQDPVITAALADFGRNGVPLYLVYRPGRDAAQVLPELLTSAIVLDALTTTLR